MDILQLDINIIVCQCLPGVLGESTHSLTLALLASPSPPIIALYCTLTGKLLTREGSQSGELAVIRVYSTVKPVVFDCRGACMLRAVRDEPARSWKRVSAASRGSCRLGDNRRTSWRRNGRSCIIGLARVLPLTQQTLILWDGLCSPLSVSMT